MEHIWTASVSGPLRSPFAERGALRVFVRGEKSFLSNLRDSLAVLASSAGPLPRLPDRYLLRNATLAKQRANKGTFFLAILLHAAVLSVLVYLPAVLPADDAELLHPQMQQEPIYFRVPLPAIKTPLPRIIPSGGGGRPGAGSRPEAAPSQGSSAPHPAITIVSKPVHPDNTHQTIYQATAPPDLKIDTDQPLPNIVMSHVTTGPKAFFHQSDAKPLQNNRQVADNAAPVDVNPLTTTLKPAENQPRLAIPAAGGGAPAQRSSRASSEAASASSLEGQDLMILGVDPTSSQQFSLPNGNRWGEFSIAPPTGYGGSPGGDAKGVPSGGTGGGTLGGDGSTGVGSSHLGGGGGNSGAPGPVSISGPGTSGASGGSLAMVAPSMVFPVPAPALNIRKNNLVVSAGPIGGGGINVYGALNCGNIYSIFLPMPGKSWSLQYCEMRAAAPQPAPTQQTYASVVRLQNPILPPDADLAQRYDFKRLPLPPEKAQHTILLKGSIATDGSVQHVLVYQGVQQDMDEAARLALSKWHFRPAMRDGKPIEVEILVGIPPETGEDRVNR